VTRPAAGRSAALKALAGVIRHQRRLVTHQNGYLVTISYSKLTAFRRLFGPPFTIAKGYYSPFPHTKGVKGRGTAAGSSARRSPARAPSSPPSTPTAPAASAGTSSRRRSPGWTSSWAPRRCQALAPRAQ
jgi:hypothetical protein